MAARRSAPQATQTSQPAPTVVKVSDQSYQPHRNRRGGYCHYCGEWVEAGTGDLTHFADEEDVDFLGNGHSWIVSCWNDRAGCAERVEAAREARKAKLDDAPRPWPRTGDLFADFWGNHEDIAPGN